MSESSHHHGIPLNTVDWKNENMIGGYPMSMDLHQLMKKALEEAKQGSSEGEVPVGAVLATASGEIIASAHNQPIALNDPSAHAEILAMRKAGAALHNYRLTQTVLVVTIEPCLMCMGACLHSRISSLVYGAKDPKAGAAGSVYNLAADSRLNHKIEVIPGIMAKECRALLQDFFRVRRETGQTKQSGEVPKWS